MFRTVILWCIAMRCLVAEGQQLKLGNNPASINKASLLELESNKQGLLLPRIPDTTVSPLTAAPTGMLIFFNGDSSFRLRKGARWQTIGATNLGSSVSGYNVILNSSTGNGTSFALPRDSLSRLSDVVLTALTSGQLLQYNGSAWVNVSALALTATNPLRLTGVQTGVSTDSVLTITGGLVRKLPATTFSIGANNWNILGNSIASTNFLGSTNNIALHFRTNNVERMYIDSSFGYVGIGSNQFTAGNPEMLLINAGTSNSFNAVTIKGNENNYFQLNINNQNSGNSSSSDLVATADNGNENKNFVDLGINSSTFNTGQITGGADNAYLYSTGNDFVIGNGTGGKNLIFFTNGTNTNNEAMRINSNGQVGIANTSPAANLDDGGTFKLGSKGTVLNNIIKGSYTVTGGAIAVGVAGTTTINVAIANAPVHATVTVSPEAALPTGTIIAYAFVSSNGNVTIAFSSVALLGSSIPNNTVFDITVIQ